MGIVHPLYLTITVSLQIVSKIVLAAYNKMKLLLTLTLVLAMAMVVYSADSSSSSSSDSSSSSSSTAAAEVPDKCPEVTKTTKYKPKTSETANVAACDKYYICRKGQKDYAPTLRSCRGKYFNNAKSACEAPTS